MPSELERQAMTETSPDPKPIVNLEEVKERLREIQGGDWEIIYEKGPNSERWAVEFPVRIHAYDVDADEDGRACDYGADVCEIVDTDRDEANAQFIKHAPTDMRALLALVKWQEKEIERRDALLRDAKREMWMTARNAWTMADFKRWDIIERIDAVLHPALEQQRHD